MTCRHLFYHVIFLRPYACVYNLNQELKLNGVCSTGETLDHGAGHGAEAEHQGYWH